MCGIAGTVRRSAGREQVCRALDTMISRGPDAHGIWERDGVTLGHRRLSILDLSDKGRQPMTDPSQRVAVTFNGEIYNYRELRDVLEGTYRFQTDTDTEVLLAGYLAWGMEELLRQVRGMFAFGLWDERNKTLYLARDPFGKKPLYYLRDSSSFAFASTMNALLCFLARTPDVDSLALDDYLTYMAVPGEQSIFCGIRKLLPAHFGVYRDGRWSTHRYWQLSHADPLDITEQEALDEVDRRLTNAVRRRLMSDVPIGAFLSGGVDSSLVCAMMARQMDEPITTLTMGFEDARFDERPYARLVSTRYQTRHQEQILQEEMWPLIPSILHEFGEPFADSSALPTYMVSKFAKEHVTVVLNGDGGDELFAGYARPLVEVMARRYRRVVPAFVRGPIGAALQGREKMRPRFASGVKQVLEAGQGSARDMFVFDRALRSYRDGLYSDEFSARLDGHHPDEWYHRIWDESDGPTDVDKVLYGDAMTYLPDELLPKMDAMTMAHSLEARSPLLDVDLAEFVARIPYGLKIQGFDTKVLLKKLALRYVPREVVYRPKKGFNMPLAHWLTTVLKEPVEDVLFSKAALSRGFFRPDQVRTLVNAHLEGKRDHAQQIWSLFNLELWFRMYIDRDLSPDLPIASTRREVLL